MGVEYNNDNGNNILRHDGTTFIEKSSEIPDDSNLLGRDDINTVSKTNDLVYNMDLSIIEGLLTAYSNNSLGVGFEAVKQNDDAKIDINFDLETALSGSLIVDDVFLQLAPLITSDNHTLRATIAPSDQPSLTPSALPSLEPSVYPSLQPSADPSVAPSAVPTSSPSSRPSKSPSGQPSLMPTELPSRQPSLKPSSLPSNLPSLSPSSLPSNLLSSSPSSDPSASSVPSAFPTIEPSFPSLNPSATPSGNPTTIPSTQPSVSPSVSSSPSSNPSSTPTVLPSSLPSLVPSSEPTVLCEENRRDVFAYEYKKKDGVIIGVVEKKCSWLARKDDDRIADICSNDISLGHILRAFDICVITCKRCVIEPTMSPTSIPSHSPSESPSLKASSMPSTLPSVSPSEYVFPSESPSTYPSSNPTIFWECEEDPDTEYAYRYIYSKNKKNIKGVKKRTCSHLRGMKDLAKIDVICDPKRDIHYNDVKSAWDTCFITCGRCKTEAPTQGPSFIESSSPSSKPSPSPSNSPSMKASSRPTSSPSIAASNVPTRSSYPSLTPSFQPSSKPSSSPTVVPNSSPSDIPTMLPSSVPSKSCQDHRGTFGANGKLTCAKIRKYKTEKRDKKCEKEKVYELCQITCGLCCKDDNHYTFIYKNRERDCVWLANETPSKIEKLCDDFGDSIQLGCVKTCGLCYPFPYPTSSPLHSVLLE